ncbi:MAG: acyl-CoA dehydrogenase [Acidobacteriota bacterium]
MNNTFAFAQEKEKKNKNLISDVLEKAKNLTKSAMAEAAVTDFVESFPAETFKHITETKLHAAPLPEKFGGVGLGLENDTTLEMLRFLKYFGYGNQVVGRVYEGHFNALLLLKLFATEKQFQIYAADVVKNNKIFGVWNTEASDGVKIFPAGKDKFRLEGFKIFATGVDYVERPIVNGAMPDGGWQMCVVPMEKVKTNIDASWWNPLGMKSTRSFRVDFTGVELTKDNLIGEPNDYYSEPYFSGGAIRFAAVQLGAAEAIFDETRKYLQKLNRTNDLFQQARLGEMAIRVESGNLWLEGAARSFENYRQNPTPENSEKFLAYANMMRTAIEQICQDVMLLCERSIGARGLNKPLHFERIIRDLTIYLRQPAPDAALAAAGKYVLDNEIHSNDLWGK